MAQEADFPKTNLFPAFPIASFHRDLLALSFSRRKIAALFEQTAFPQIPKKSHRLCFWNDDAKEISNHPLRTKDLSPLFEFNERTVRKTLARGPQEPGPLGRQAPLKPEAESSLVALLVEVFEAGKAITFKAFLQFVREQHDPQLTKGLEQTSIGPHLGELQLCQSMPQEETRLTVPRADLDDCINVLPIHLVRKVPELVFNLDELGSADFHDRKGKKVIPAWRVRKEDVDHAVSQCGCHMTLLVCLSAAGDALTPLIVTASPIRGFLSSRNFRRDNECDGWRLVASLCR
jgi:hypothetical protein